jgi:hypothetical protein
MVTLLPYWNTAAGVPDDETAAANEAPTARAVIAPIAVLRRQPRLDRVISTDSSSRFPLYEVHDKTTISRQSRASYVYDLANEAPAVKIL